MRATFTVGDNNGDGKGFVSNTNDDVECSSSGAICILLAMVDVIIMVIVRVVVVVVTELLLNVVVIQPQISYD